MQRNKFQIADNIMATIPIKGVSINDIMKIIELSDELNEKNRRHQIARKKIFTSYNIENDQQFFSHAQFKTISEAINQLDEGEEKINVVPFLDLKTFENIIENYDNLNVTGVKILRELLLKKK